MLQLLVLAALAQGAPPATPWAPLGESQILPFGAPFQASAGAGGLVHDQDANRHPALLMGPKGPLAVWLACNDLQCTVQTRLWTGKVWQVPVDPLPLLTRDPTAWRDGYPDLRVSLTPNGALNVTVVETMEEGDAIVQVHQQRGRGWKFLASNVTPPEARGTLALAVGPDPWPVAAWLARAEDGRGTIQVRRMTRKGWARVGDAEGWAEEDAQSQEGWAFCMGQAQNAAFCRGVVGDTPPHLALDSKGRPLVGWADEGGLSLRQWDDQEWRILQWTPPSRVRDLTRSSGILLTTTPDGRPLVVHEVLLRDPVRDPEGRRLPMRYQPWSWDGKAWQPLAPPLDAPEGLLVDRGFGLDLLNQSTLVLGTSAWGDPSPDGLRLLEVQEGSSLGWRTLGARRVQVRPGEQVAVLPTVEGPLVAWSDAIYGEEQIRVARLGQGGWESLEPLPPLGPGLSDAGQRARWITAFNDPKGNPGVLWISDRPEDGESLWLRRWDGKAWSSPVELTGTLGTEACLVDAHRDQPWLGVWPPALSFDASGRAQVAFVAWSRCHPPGSPQAMAEKSRPVLVRWTDGAVVTTDALDAGVSGWSMGFLSPPAVDAQGRVTLLMEGRSYTGSTQRLDLVVRRWDGQSWENLGGAAWNRPIGDVEESAVRPPWASLALDGSGQPVVAWQGTWNGRPQVWLKRWTGQAWEALGRSAEEGGVSNTSDPALVRAVRVDPKGRVLVAFWDQGNGSDVRVSRWDGTSWSPLGVGATGTRGPQTWMSLELDAQGEPMLAWEDTTGGRRQIHVRRWDGQAWSDGGLASTSPGPARYPSLFHLGDRACVAWTEGGAGLPQVVARCQEKP